MKIGVTEFIEKIKGLFKRKKPGPQDRLPMPKKLSTVWTPAHICLPSDNRLVLVYNKGFYIGFYSNKGHWVTGSSFTKQVSHWCELPEKPKN